MNYVTHKYLDILENIIDIEHVSRTRELQKAAFAFQPVHHIPTVINYEVPPDEWPIYRFDEIYENLEKMLINELRAVYIGAKVQDDRLYGIRANYGTGIIASVFGCETRVFGNTLPTGIHVSPQKLAKILESEDPDINSGLMPRVFETAGYFRQILSKHPKLSQVIGSQMFDIQGPFDNASMIWGSDVYYALYDDPEKVKMLFSKIKNVILKSAKRLREIDNCPVHEHDGAWNHVGGLVIRLDSCINLSAEHYTSIVKPFDEQLLKEFGGWIHFCGNANHWWRYLLDIPNLKGINPHQGEFYDLYELYDECERAKVPIIQWTVPMPLEARCRERIKTGISRIVDAKDFNNALRLRDILYSSGHAE